MFSHTQEEKTGGEYLSQSLSKDREVITIGIGACGNRMSCGFWRNILDEHNLDFDGTILDKGEISNDPLSDIGPDRSKEDDYKVDNTRIGTYFREMKDIKGKYVPRNIICDLDVTTIDSVRASNLGSLFNADQYIYSGNSANNLFSLGYSNNIIDEVFDEIRTEAEKCSSIQGFKILHGIGGGTGSGLTAYLAQLLKDEFYDRIITSYTVYPSNKASDIVIEPFNMMLCMPSLLSYHDMNACIDNETLFDISGRLFHNDRPTFADLNEYICNIISSSTAGIRFKGSLNMDLRKLATNILPFPRLKFLSISDAPLMYNHARKYTKISIESLITELFHGHQFLSNIDVGRETHGWNGKYLACSVIFRGLPVNSYNIKLNEWEIVNGLRKTCDELRYNDECLITIPNLIHSTLVYQPSQSYPLTGTLFANNTAIKHLYKRNLKRFNKFYKKKAYLQYYTMNGTLDEDFEESINEIKDLIEDYNDKDGQDVHAFDNVDDLFQLDHNKYKKLEKNDEFWQQNAIPKKKKLKSRRKKKAKVVKKNKKVYIKKNKRSNKRAVIIGNNAKKNGKSIKTKNGKKGSKGSKLKQRDNKKPIKIRGGGKGQKSKKKVIKKKPIKKMIKKSKKKGKKKKKVSKRTRVSSDESEDDDFEEMSSSSESEESDSDSSDTSSNASSDTEDESETNNTSSDSDSDSDTESSNDSDSSSDNDSDSDSGSGSDDTNNDSSDTNSDDSNSDSSDSEKTDSDSDSD